MRCRCYCDGKTNGNSHFLPGHDQIAVANAIAANYGSNEAFIRSQRGEAFDGPFGLPEVNRVIMEDYGSSLFRC